MDTNEAVSGRKEKNETVLWKLHSNFFSYSSPSFSLAFFLLVNERLSSLVVVRASGALTKNWQKRDVEEQERINENKIKHEKKKKDSRICNKRRRHNQCLVIGGESVQSDEGNVYNSKSLAVMKARGWIEEWNVVGDIFS